MFSVLVTSGWSCRNAMRRSNGSKQVRVQQRRVAEKEADQAFALGFSCEGDLIPTCDKQHRNIKYIFA